LLLPTPTREHSLLAAPGNRRASIAATLVTIGVLALASRPARAAEPKKIFNSRCTACHTFGHGVKVGPDLKGVTARRQRPWLVTFIRGSQRVIKSGDPVATELFERFKEQRMPDWSDLSPEAVNAILDWFAADGPEQKEPDERDAELATSADVARARALFDGATPMASGGLACAACHSVREGSSRRGGSLGPELTEAYLKYRDRALTTFLKRPCTPREPELSAARYLTPEESFALKGYLRQLALAASPFAAYPLGAQTTGAGHDAQPKSGDNAQPKKDQKRGLP
jgi:mono/diheme cytochrome c family protein